jgi:hypothetical protein
MESLFHLFWQVCHYLFSFLYYYYLFAILYLIYRKATTIPSQNILKNKTLMIVFGSGGHTTEMLLMLTKKGTHEFDFTKYKEVHFVIGHSDTWSITKIKDYFAQGKRGFEIFS